MRAVPGGDPGNPAESDGVRVYAMAALRDMGTPESHRQAWEILRAMPALPRLMCSVACEALIPEHDRSGRYIACC